MFTFDAGKPRGRAGRWRTPSDHCIQVVPNPQKPVGVYFNSTLKYIVNIQLWKYVIAYIHFIYNIAFFTKAQISELIAVALYDIYKFPVELTM